MGCVGSSLNDVYTLSVQDLIVSNSNDDHLLTYCIKCDIVIIKIKISHCAICDRCHDTNQYLHCDICNICVNPISDIDFIKHRKLHKTFMKKNMKKN
jgi:hypothetical protein